jgi:hypothetical protein
MDRDFEFESELEALEFLPEERPLQPGDCNRSCTIFSHATNLVVEPSS